MSCLYFLLYNFMFLYFHICIYILMHIHPCISNLLFSSTAFSSNQWLWILKRYCVCWLSVWSYFDSFLSPNTQTVKPLLYLQSSSPTYDNFAFQHEDGRPPPAGNPTLYLNLPKAAPSYAAVAPSTINTHWSTPAPAAAAAPVQGNICSICLNQWKCPGNNRR